MLRLVQLFLLTFFVLLIINCNKPTGPVLSDVTTTETELANFQVIIADYDSVVFKSNEDLLLKTKDVKEIILIGRDGEIFEDLKIIEPIYAKVGNKYRLEFEITTLVRPETYIKHYILKFNMVDNLYIEFEKVANLYKYPYENAELFMLQEEYESLVGLSAIQDFDIVDDQLFYHPYGPLGLYKYNLSTHTAPDTLYDYPSGDHIAVAEDYVFIDYAHSRIERYNTDSDSIDLVFDLSQISWPNCDYTCSNLHISGIAANNNIVYVLFQNNETENIYLIQFDYGGNYLGSAPWSKEYPYNLEYHDGVLYSYKYFFGENEILRFDLNSMSFLESKPIPSASPGGISIVNGRFYYADYNRKIICLIPISDLMD